MYIRFIALLLFVLLSGCDRKITHKTDTTPTNTTLDETPPREKSKKDIKEQPKPVPLIDTPMAHKLAAMAQKTKTAIDDELKKMAENQGVNMVKGLTNCGNTCYMNALLQALIHSDLGRYTQVPFDQIHFAPEIREFGTVTPFDKDLGFFKIFYSLAQDYLTRPSPLNTSEIAKARKTFMPLLKENVQADAREYLDALFLRFGLELNVITKDPERFDATSSEQANFPFARSWIMAGRLGEYSIIQDLFGYYQKTRKLSSEPINAGDVVPYDSVTKLYTYTSFDFATSLELSFLPQKNRVTLKELLAHFSKEEAITDAPTLKSRTIALYTAPKNLIIQLKRFTQLDTGEFIRNDSLITYPAKLSFDTESEGRVNYALFSVVLHSGSLTGGHYTAMVKTFDNKWYLADDSTISPKSETDALGEDKRAYLLFYRKI